MEDRLVRLIRRPWVIAGGLFLAVLGAAQEGLRLGSILGQEIFR